MCEKCIAGFIHRCEHHVDVVYLMDCVYSMCLFRLFHLVKLLTASVTRIDINYTCVYVHWLVIRPGQFDCGYPNDSAVLCSRYIFYPYLKVNLLFRTAKVSLLSYRGQFQTNVSKNNCFKNSDVYLGIFDGLNRNYWKWGYPWLGNVKQNNTQDHSHLVTNNTHREEGTLRIMFSNWRWSRLKYLWAKRSVLCCAPGWFNLPVSTTWFKTPWRLKIKPYIPHEDALLYVPNLQADTDLAEREWISSITCLLRQCMQMF